MAVESSGGVPDLPPPAARLDHLFSRDYAAVWRLVRRSGLSDEAAADTAQQAFLITAERLHEIAPGRERSFVFQTAFRLCLSAKRQGSRVSLGHSGDERVSGVPSADELTDLKRARAVLDQILDRMPDASRMVFVMFELEGFRIPQIADLLDIPIGTATSRLRRAREQFRAAVKTFEKGGSA